MRGLCIHRTLTKHAAICRLTPERTHRGLQCCLPSESWARSVSKNFLFLSEPNRPRPSSAQDFCNSHGVRVAAPKKMGEPKEVPQRRGVRHAPKWTNRKCLPRRGCPQWGQKGGAAQRDPRGGIPREGVLKGSQAGVSRTRGGFRQTYPRAHEGDLLVVEAIHGAGRRAVPPARSASTAAREGAPAWASARCEAAGGEATAGSESGPFRAG